MDVDRPADGVAPAVRSDDTGAPPAPRWGLADAAAAYAASVVLSALVGAVWIGVTGRRDLTLGLTVVTLLGQWVGMVTVVVVASRTRGAGDLTVDYGLRIERRDILPGIGAGVASQLVVLPLLYLPARLLAPDLDLSENARRVTNLATGPGLIVLAAFIVVGAPLVEELFFRGLLQRSLVRRVGPAWGVVGSGLLFGATHFEPVLLPGLAAFGMVLGWLTHRSGRLGPAIVAHMAFNALTVAALAL